MDNIVFYSYKKSIHDHINHHELKRFEHSISTLRDFNNEIPVYLFCDDPSFIPSYFTTDLSVKVVPFVEGNDHGFIFIYRWINLQYFEEMDANILYVDSDTIFAGDPQYLFDHYNYRDVFGREEFGFRHDPNIGGGRNIRRQYDMVDSGIKDLGGKSHVYNYCVGVLLFNNNIHRELISRGNELIELLTRLTNNEIPMPIPNRRIVDEYSVWVTLSRIGASCGLFAVQDVSQGWIEKKHEEYFNPIVCHYTTNHEQAFAKSNEKYNNLIRDTDELREEIDPYAAVSAQTLTHLTPEMVEMLAGDEPIVATDLWADLDPDD